MDSQSTSVTSPLRPHFIYAIMRPNTSMVHITHTVVPKISKFFNKHSGGHVGATASMARQAADEGQHLSIYLLETYDTDSDADAYHRCIAWQRLAVQAGYALLSVADQTHVDSMNDAERRHCDALRHHDIRVLCSPERDLVPGILARQRGPRNKQDSHTIRVIIPHRQYVVLSRKARCHGSTLSDYLLTCATNSTSGVDLSEIIAVRAEVQQVLSLLRSVVVRLELTPSDIRALLDAIRHIRAELSTVTQCLTKLTSKH